MPDGSLVCSLANKQRMTIPCPDALGMAAMLNVPPEKLEFMTAEEYERESEDEDDERN